MVDLIPRSVLFASPERTSPQISPDGSALAWIAPRDGVLNLWVAPAGGEPGVDWAAARPLIEDADRGIRAFAPRRSGVAGGGGGECPFCGQVEGGGGGKNRAGLRRRPGVARAAGPDAVRG